MTAIFPALPGLGWSVTKTPRFAGRVHNAVSGRELRVLDQPYPVWTWTLTYSLLRDQWDTRAAGGPGSGYDELRTLAGFFLQQQGTFQPFLSEPISPDYESDLIAQPRGVVPHSSRPADRPGRSHKCARIGGNMPSNSSCHIDLAEP